MPRAATTSDAFNAVAEPRRRDILNFLALQERPVGDIVDSLGMEQPSVSKHLRVLRDVGLVVRHAVCVVDREEGGADTLARLGVRLRSIFRASELLSGHKSAAKPHG